MDGNIIVSAASHRDWIDYFTLTFTGLGVIVVALYTAVTYRQVRLTRDALKEAERGNELAERNFRLGQRAYVVADSIVGATPLTKIIIKNVGATPANNLSVRGRVNLDGESSVIPDEILASGEQSGGPEFAIGPGQSFIKEVSFPLLSGVELGNIIRSRAQVYAYCEIDYRDIFGKNHKTTACWTYEPGVPAELTWKFASKHNRIG